MGKMKKLEKILNNGKKRGRNLIIGGSMMLGLAGGLNEVEGQSRFYQPLDTYDFYGSGDVNNDFKINNEDAIVMQDVINGTYNFEEGDYIGRKRADVNFDGLVTQTDLNILNNYLNGETLLTPGWHYNQLKTPQQRLERIDQITGLAGLQSICDDAPLEENCNCDQIAYNAILVIEGPEDQEMVDRIKISAPHNYDSTQFGIFKIPTDFVALIDYDVPSGHAMNRFNIGNDLIKLSDGVNYDAELALLDIGPGEGNFRGIDSFFEHLGLPKGPMNNPLSKYYRYIYKDRVPTLDWVWGQLDEVVGSKRDTISPIIEHNLEQGKVYDGSPRIQVSFIEDNFNQAYITKDNGETRIPLSAEGNNFNLNLPKGEHEVAIYVQDKAGLETLQRINFETLSPNSIEEKAQIPKLHMFPNPPRDFVRAQYEKGQDAYLEVFNTSGQLIKKKIDLDQNGETGFNSSDLEKGLYIVRVRNGKGNVLGTDKLVKQ